MEFASNFLKQQKNNDLLRSLRPIEQRGGGRVVYEGVEYWDFSSNDYLGFSTHPALAEAATNALKEWGAGSTASRQCLSCYSINQTSSFQLLYN